MTSPDLLDQPTTVRPGEALDTERLAAYLREHIPGLTGELTVEQFPSGYSNLTYGLRLGEREMVLRRPPFGANIRGGHDMGREYRVLAGLIRVYPKVPRPLVYCEDLEVLGAPFYVMERVRGVVLRPHNKAALARLTPDVLRGLAWTLADTLAELHALDYTAAGLGDLGKPDGYVARQVNGWIGRYEKAQTDAIPAMDQVAAWLRAHIPAHSDASLIHNDFKHDNLVLDPDDLTRIVAILDWEMATLGDPLSDLGTTLAYWAEPTDPPALQRFGLSALPGNPTRQEFVDRYAARSGRDLSPILFHFVYGLYKNAVIIQQIYARYKAGFTQDARFASLIDLVHVDVDVAVRAIETNHLSALFSRSAP